jgi:hypothetical protein
MTKKDAAIFVIIGIATLAVEVSINTVVFFALPVTLLACLLLLKVIPPK